MSDTVDNVWNDLVGVLGEGDVGSDMTHSLTACEVSVLCCLAGWEHADP